MTARDQLAHDHMDLARRRARRIAFETGLPADEAESAALLGLGEAIERYRPELGEFAPFAGRTIDGAVRTAAREWRWRRRAEHQPGRDLAAGDTEPLLDLVPDTLTTAELVEARTDIARALLALDQTERQIVLLHGKLGHPLSIVSVMLDLDGDHTRYLWSRALRKMRARLESAPIAAPAAA